MKNFSHKLCEKWWWLSPVRRMGIGRSSTATVDADGLNFAALVLTIQRIHEESAAAVKRVVNTALTLRNWMIGAYIVEYEMYGADRARYGAELLDRLAQRLQAQQVPPDSAVGDRTICRSGGYLAYADETIWRQVVAKLPRARMAKADIGRSI